MEIRTLADVVKFLKKKQCWCSARTGNCEHPACREARDAEELVNIASEMLDVPEQQTCAA